MNIEQEINKLKNDELPSGLHNRILRQVIFLRMRTPFLALGALLSFNAYLSGTHIWEFFRDNEVLSTIKTLFEGFELSFDFLQDALTTFLTYLPIRLLTIFTLSVVALIYLLLLYREIRFYDTKVASHN